MSDAEKADVGKESHPTVPAADSSVKLNLSIHDCVIALPDSLGELCCDTSGRLRGCHCKGSICCYCLYPEDETVIESEGLPSVYKYCKLTKRSCRQSETDSAENPEKSTFLIDLVKVGFKTAFLRLAYVFRFIRRAQHAVHLKHGVERDTRCKMCCVIKEIDLSGMDLLFKKDLESPSVLAPRVVFCSQFDFHSAWEFMCRQGSKEVMIEYRSKPKKLDSYDEKDGILFSAGRLSYPVPPLNSNPELPLFHDVKYFQPVFLNTSIFTYALVMYVHWEICPHSGIERTLSVLSRMIYVEQLRKIVKFVRETCPRCRYLLKKHYVPATGNQAIYSLLRAPPFYACMIDVAGGFVAYDSIKRRISKESYFLVQVCLITGAVAIEVLEDLTTHSIILAMSRTAHRYGWSKYVLADNQSSFKTLETIQISFTDLQNRLWLDQRLTLDFSTPHAHNEHGRVESKVKVLKEFFSKSAEFGKKHTYLEWQTIGSSVASAINDIPICHNQDDRHTDDFLGLVTPNMLLIGRNNARAPDGFVNIELNPIKALENLSQLNSGMLDLLGDYVHRFIPGKQVAQGQCPEIDDVVIFLVKEANRSRNKRYKYGRVVKINLDGRPNKILIKYRNAGEAIYREVERNVKDVILIQAASEIDFNTTEHKLAASIQRKYLMSCHA